MGKRAKRYSRKWEACLTIALFASFFLPWIYSLGSPIPGHQIRERLAGPHHLVSSFTSKTRLSEDYGLALGLYLVPGLALVLFTLILARRYRSWMGTIAGLTTLGIFLFLKSEIENFPFHSLAPGIYLALGAGLGLTFSPFFRGK